MEFARPPSQHRSLSGRRPHSHGATRRSGCVAPAAASTATAAFRHGSRPRSRSATPRRAGTSAFRRRSRRGSPQARSWTLVVVQQLVEVDGRTARRAVSRSPRWSSRSSASTTASTRRISAAGLPDSNALTHARDTCARAASSAWLSPSSRRRPRATAARSWSEPIRVATGVTDRDDRDEGLGGVARGVDGEEGEDDRGYRDGEQDDRDIAAGVGPAPIAGEADEQEDHQRDGAADRRDRGEIDEVGDDEDEAGGDEQAAACGRGASPRRRTRGTAVPARACPSGSTRRRGWRSWRRPSRAARRPP